MSETVFHPNQDATKASLTDMFMKNAAITGYALEVQKYHIIPLPKESLWYKDFQASLTTAQKNASYWITDLSPSLFSEVPQSIIDYGNLFNAATGEVQRILDDMGSRVLPTSSEREALHAIFSAMLDELRGKQTTIDHLKEDLKKFKKSLDVDFQAMKTAREAAVKECGLDKAAMEAIEREIEALKAEIKAANTKQAVSAIGLGVSLFVLVAAVGVAFATGGAAAPLVVGAVAIVGATAGTVGLIVYTGQINDKIKELQRKYSDLGDEQRQVAALGMVTGSLDNLTKDCEKAMTALGDVLKMWAVLEGKIQSVIKEIDKADAAKIRNMISIHLTASRQSWSQLIDYAILLQRCGAQPEVKVIPHETAKAA